MLLEVRLYSGLEKYVQGAKYGKPMKVEMPDGTTGRQLLDKLGIPQEQVFSILVNGTHRDRDEVMEDGDRVALFPPVGGG
ncbi:MAG: MoaD/ThiS family protein [Desulfotomaculum sp.]|nr:MoaD/ThiS family protein [Desulfotomaculum sp.]